MNTFDYLNSTMDPWKVLGLSRDADNTEIEKAWKQLSGSRHKEDKINQAYRMIASEEARAQWKLLYPGRQETLEGILENMPLRPQYTGPGLWYQSLKDVIEKEEV
jgi:DnaJ-class molecular chaperone